VATAAATAVRQAAAVGPVRVAAAAAAAAPAAAAATVILEHQLLRARRAETGTRKDAIEDRRAPTSTNAYVVATRSTVFRSVRSLLGHLHRHDRSEKSAAM